jgi:hypothetical protein
LEFVDKATASMSNLKWRVQTMKRKLNEANKANGTAFELRRNAIHVALGTSGDH